MFKKTQILLIMLVFGLTMHAAFADPVSAVPPDNLIGAPPIAEPAIASPPEYGQRRQKQKNNTVDVLIQKPKNKIGGSQHQNNEIKQYFGLHY